MKGTLIVRRRETLLVDPTRHESEACDCLLTVVMDSERRICALDVPGGAGLTSTYINQCIATTAHRVDYIVSTVLGAGAI